MSLLPLLGVLLAFPLAPEDPPADAAPPTDLKAIEEALKTSPDDPMLHYRKAQALFAKGQEQAAVDHAAVAAEKFNAAGTDLPWLSLGSFKAAGRRVEVRYNNGPKERAETKDGIVRPYSFLVWTDGEEEGLELERRIDFEHGYFDGERLTAALGATTPDGHANFGVVAPDSDFATVKKKVVSLLKP